MWLLIIGPRINPIFDATVHQYIAQIRARELNKSSILPPTIFPGTAETSPAMTRITIAAGRELTVPMTIQQAQLSALLIIYNFLRPKDSVHGGNTIVPTHCPRRNLMIVREEFRSQRKEGVSQCHKAKCRKGMPNIVLVSGLGSRGRASGAAGSSV